MPRIKHQKLNKTMLFCLFFFLLLHKTLLFDLGKNNDRSQVLSLPLHFTTIRDQAVFCKILKFIFLLGNRVWLRLSSILFVEYFPFPSSIEAQPFMIHHNPRLNCQSPSTTHNHRYCHHRQTSCDS